MFGYRCLLLYHLCIGFLVASVVLSRANTVSRAQASHVQMDGQAGRRAGGYCDGGTWNGGERSDV